MKWEQIYTIIFIIVTVFYGVKSLVDSVRSGDGSLKQLVVFKAISNIWVSVVGSVVGFAFIYLLIVNLNGDIYNMPNYIKPQHIGLFIVGLLGICGFLPRTLQGIADIFRSITKFANK